MRFLSFDLECVLDADAGRRVYGFAGTHREVREQMRQARREESQGKTDFLPPAFWRVVSVGVMGVDTMKGRVHLAAESQSEPSLVQWFADFVDLMGRPQLVSWNGNGFDLSVCRYRALLYGINLTPIYGKDARWRDESYLYRYSERHVDLMDALANYGASPNHKLAEVARIAGLPCKTVATGADVESLVEAEDWARIEAYVKEDALVTGFLFLRWQLTRGQVTRVEFDRTLDLLGAEVAETHPEFARAAGAWRREHLQLVEATA